MAKAKAVKLAAKGAKKLYKYTKNALKQGKRQGPKTRPQQATANANAKIADKAKAVGLGVRAFKKKFASVVAGEGKRATNAINKQVAAVNKGKPALKAAKAKVARAKKVAAKKTPAKKTPAKKAPAKKAPAKKTAPKGPKQGPKTAAESVKGKPMQGPANYKGNFFKNKEKALKEAQAKFMNSKAYSKPKVKSKSGESARSAGYKAGKKAAAGKTLKKVKKGVVKVAKSRITQGIASGAIGAKLGGGGGGSESKKSKSKYFTEAELQAARRRMKASRSR
jgi:hypothetical protein